MWGSARVEAGSASPAFLPALPFVAPDEASLFRCFGAMTWPSKVFCEDLHCIAREFEKEMLLQEGLSWTLPFPLYKTPRWQRRRRFRTQL